MRGITNSWWCPLVWAPATFQSLIHDLKAFFLVLVFFDDILIYSPDFESHIQDLTLVFSLYFAVLVSFFANFHQSRFAQGRLESKGHWVSKEGVSADPEKVRAIKEWPQPSNHSPWVTKFLRTSYYRSLIVDYGRIAQPLHRMPGTDAFIWTSDSVEAFSSS